MRVRETTLLLLSLWLSGIAVAIAQQTPPSASLSAVERAGEKVFLQRCSLCHLGSAPTYRPYGPPLAGRVQTAGEDRMRKIIQEGVPGMPGWRYSLDSSQIDSLIAYMRTLKTPSSGR